MPSESDKLKSLITARGVIKASITRFSEYLKRTDINVNELDMRITKLESDFRKFENVQEAIEVLDSDNDHEDYRITLEDKYFACLSQAKAIQKSNSVTQTEIRLKPIGLPEFSGKYEDWLHYRDTFNSLIANNQSLNDLQKMHYLVDSLKGEAARLISSLELSASNYESALSILKSRYENKRIIMQKHVNAIFNLQPIKTESFYNIRKLIDDCQIHIRALNSLGLPTQHWDTLIINILANKLDLNTRNIWENYPIASDFPTFNELSECLSERSRVLEATHSNTSKPPHFNNRVTLHTSSTNSNPCKCCKKEHRLYQCEKFSNMSQQQKWQFIKAQRLCSNCLTQNHKHSECKSKHNCRTCKKRHHSLLHDDSQNAASSSKSSSESSNVESLHAAHNTSNMTNETLLSTAVVAIVLPNHTTYNARSPTRLWLAN
jgi:hypothetical protein